MGAQMLDFDDLLRPFGHPFFISFRDHPNLFKLQQFICQTRVLPNLALEFWVQMLLQHDSPVPFFSAVPSCSHEAPFWPTGTPKHLCPHKGPPCVWIWDVFREIWDNWVEVFGNAFGTFTSFHCASSLFILYRSDL